MKSDIMQMISKGPFCVFITLLIKEDLQKSCLGKIQLTGSKN